MSEESTSQSTDLSSTDPASTDSASTDSGATDSGATDPGATDSAALAGDASSTAENTSMQADTDAKATPGRGRPIVRLAGKVFVAIVVIGGGGALYYWWQGQQTDEPSGLQEAFVLQRLEDTGALLENFESRFRTVETNLAASGARVEGLAADVEVIPAEVRALRREVEAIQGGQLDSRESWLREQAAYYLVLANTELALGGRIDNSIAALELADDVLRELGDPALTAVRRAIAAELQSLRSVALPDFDRHLADLAALISRVAELPMRSAAPENYVAVEESLDDVEPGLGRLWEQTKGAVTSIVRVERQNEPAAVLLSDSERRIVRRQLALELQLARTALFERRQSIFQASLVAADAILNRDFERSAQSVAEARRLLGEMMLIEVEPALPEIGDSLALLRTSFGTQ